MRYWPPPEFEVLILTLFFKIIYLEFSLFFTSFGFFWQRNTVAYDEDQQREVEEALVIQDAISDLPPVPTCFFLIFYVWTRLL
jgi:hypothetical protein